MAERENFTVYRGDDQPVRFTMTTNGLVDTWSTQFTARRTDQSNDPPALVVAGSVETPGSTSTPGVFLVQLTKAMLLLLEPRDYVYSFKRTNVGSATTLAEGRMTVRGDVLNAL